jgi:hypothetical protein
MIRRLYIYAVVRLRGRLYNAHRHVAPEPTTRIRADTWTERDKTVDPACVLQTTHSTPKFQNNDDGYC